MSKEEKIALLDKHLQCVVRTGWMEPELAVKAKEVYCQVEELMNWKLKRVEMESASAKEVTFEWRGRGGVVVTVTPEKAEFYHVTNRGSGKVYGLDDPKVAGILQGFCVKEEA